MNRLLFALCAFWLAGCERAELPVVEQQVRPAKLFQVVAQPSTIRHEFVGKLDAAQTVDVSFEVDGELLELPVREGQMVPKGALVAALDPTNFQLAVREAEVQLRLSRQDLQRKETLLRDRGISESLVDDARAQFQLNEVRLSQARKRLADSTICAPFDAYVARRYVDNRTKVQIGDRIARLSDLNELKVVASIREELVATVTLERVLSISAYFDFLPDRTFPLEFRERSGEANPVAQTFDATFTMARPSDVNLLPGMTAQVRVELMANGREAEIAIPTTALLSEASGSFFVWVYDPDSGRVTRRTVQVAQPHDKGIGIAGGLTDGELVVAAGASQLQEGMTVHPLGEPETWL